MRQVLVFGGSGQIGRPLVERLRAGGWQVVALSRHVQTDDDRLQWLRGDFEHLPALPARFEAIVSCGPLDRFGRWYAQSSVAAARVVAFGSTSLATKQVSTDPHERDLVRRLQEGEQAVFAAASASGAAATVLRPTLVYGAGRDASLSRIAALARRWRRFPLPRGATGLRQPVHVDDLAGAAVACLDRPVRHGVAYALPGGETLAYREMVARVVACVQPPARLVELPAPLFALMLRIAQLAGGARGLGAAALGRMHEDMVFDAGPAARDFGYAPRAFRPDASMFR